MLIVTFYWLNHLILQAFLTAQVIFFRHDVVQKVNFLLIYTLSSIDKYIPPLLVCINYETCQFCSTLCPETRLPLSIRLLVLVYSGKAMALKNLKRSCAVPVQAIAI